MQGLRRAEWVWASCHQMLGGNEKYTFSCKINDIGSQSMGEPSPRSIWVQRL